MTVVDVTDVTFAYSDQPALEDVSMTVDEGAFLGLVGPNGSGKTTLLELMIGLRRPEKGRISLFGKPAHERADGERVGYVPQDTGGAASEMPITVREAVRMGRYPHNSYGLFSSGDRDAIRGALTRVGITDLADRRVGRLSGGQRQRVFIARALAAEADLLALDEPTVGVDAESREDFYDLLGELNNEGLTIVLIEHDIGVVTARASEIACLNRELFFHGNPGAFVETDALAAAYGSGQHVVQHNH